MNEIKEAEKYIEFKLIEDNKRTQIWAVITKKQKYEVGTIKWRYAWGHYCFYPLADTTYSDRCLIGIGFFLKKLNDAHKKKEERIK